jgi:hypothetical protein
MLSEEKKLKYIVCMSQVSPLIPPNTIINDNSKNYEN